MKNKNYKPAERKMQETKRIDADLCGFIRFRADRSALSPFRRHWMVASSMFICLGRAGVDLQRFPISLRRIDTDLHKLAFICINLHKSVSIGLDGNSEAVKSFVIKSSLHSFKVRFETRQVVTWLTTSTLHVLSHRYRTDSITNVPS